MPDRLDSTKLVGSVSGGRKGRVGTRWTVSIAGWFVATHDSFNSSTRHSIVGTRVMSGYIPGVRENGGQYTHAAIWAAMAFAAMGDTGTHECRRAWELFSLLNPIAHGASSENMQIYKVEPYVMSADVYAAPPHTGRGGWTWYTGSSGWMYRLITESLLGIKLQADILRFNPCLPPQWQTFKITTAADLVTSPSAARRRKVRHSVVDGWKKRIRQSVLLTITANTRLR